MDKKSYCPKCEHEVCLACIKKSWGHRNPLGVVIVHCCACGASNDSRELTVIPIGESKPKLTYPDLFEEGETKAK